jgi:hypothetical protein
MVSRDQHRDVTLAEELDHLFEARSVYLPHITVEDASGPGWPESLIIRDPRTVEACRRRR